MVESIAPTPLQTPVPAAGTAATSERSRARRELLMLLIKRPAFIIGIAVILVWIVCAVLGGRITPYDPFNSFFLPGHQPLQPSHAAPPIKT